MRGNIYIVRGNIKTLRMMTGNIHRYHERQYLWRVRWFAPAKLPNVPAMRNGMGDNLAGFRLQGSLYS